MLLEIILGIIALEGLGMLFIGYRLMANHARAEQFKIDALRGARNNLDRIGWIMRENLDRIGSIMRENQE